MNAMEHPSSVFDTAFTDEQRHEQELEDSQAWWAVAGILFSIVGFGLLLGVSAVLIILNN